MTEHEIRVERYLHAIVCLLSDFMEQRFSSYSCDETLKRSRKKLCNTVRQLANERHEEEARGEVSKETKNKINEYTLRY